MATLALCAAMLSGCAAPQWVTVRDAPRNPLAERLMLLSRGGPRPTERTLVFMRKYNLEGHVHDKPEELVHQIQVVIDREPSSEALAAAAELSYIGGVRSQLVGNSRESLDLFGTSVAYSYAYLFGLRPNRFHNPYDPQFRGTCDLYNAGLEAALRSVKKQSKFRAGAEFNVDVKGEQYDVTIVPRNVPWPADDIDHFEFASDYEIHGLKNLFHTYGLGVPLIAVRKEHVYDDPLDKHYAPGVSFPVTAFLRCLAEEPSAPLASTTPAGQTDADLSIRKRMNGTSPIPTRTFMVDIFCCASKEAEEERWASRCSRPWKRIFRSCRAT